MPGRSGRAAVMATVTCCDRVGIGMAFTSRIDFRDRRLATAPAGASGGPPIRASPEGSARQVECTGALQRPRRRVRIFAPGLLAGRQTMRTHFVAATTLAALALGAGAGSRPSFAKSAAPAIDPDAIDALHKMGAFLRDQQKFTVRATATTDDLLSSGQKVQFSGTMDMMVRRPDRLRADIRGDRRDEHLYYDGKTFTIFGERVGYFASFAAPPTLAELKTETEKRTASTCRWPTSSTGARSRTGPRRSPRRPRSASPPSKGPPATTTPSGRRTSTGRSGSSRGRKPLPRKLVITTTGDKSRPQHSAVMSWDLSPQLGEELFTFVPPPEAHKIDFENVTAARARR